MAHTLNEEQAKAAAHQHGALLILAGAGAGKTRVIVERIATLIKNGVAPERILAVTFTNKAAAEMRERIAIRLRTDLSLSPFDTPATSPFIGTFHSLSLHIIKTFHDAAGLPRRFTIYDRSDSTRAVKEAIRGAGFDPKELEPRRVMGRMGRMKGDDVSREDFLAEHATSYIDEAIAEVWERYDAILKKENALDFDDILVRALWLLRTNPTVRDHFQKAWEYIHVDEYQDTNNVQYALIKLLAETHGNVAVVGDVDQCLVKGTRITLADGSLQSIEHIKKGDAILSNFGSGDMRPALVSRTRTRMHRGELIRITTDKGHTLTSTPEHMHFAGFRLGLTPQYHFTYLMHKKGVGWRLGVSQVYTKGQRKPMMGFVQRNNQEHADEVWIVGVHATSQDARVHEYTLSLRYQIPTLPFVARKGLSVGGYVHDQKVLDKIYSSVDSARGAHTLLALLGLHLKHPHHRAQGNTGTRRNIVVTLCADRRGKTPMHRISMVGADAQGKKVLASLGFSVRPAKKGSASWRFETVMADFDALQSIVEKIQRALPDAVTVEQACLGANTVAKSNASLRFMPAGSVLPGMALFDSHGGYKIVQKVERIEKGATRVYDIDVTPTHNFIANGVATHNCIYSWRGASIKHIMRFEEDYPSAVLVILTRNYRSTKTIIAAANEAIAKNIHRREKELVTDNPDGERIKIGGFMDEGEEARYVAHESQRLIKNGVDQNDIAILYRANFQSRVLEEAFLSIDVPYQVLGTRFFERKEVKDALSYLRAALNPGSVADISRIINVPARGVGKVGLSKILLGQKNTLAPAVRIKVEQFYALLSRIKNVAETRPTSEAVKYALTESGMWRMYEHGDTEDEERLENLKELVTVATKYDAHPIGEGIDVLIEEAALQSDQDELAKKEGKKKDGVKLMTVHAAKGLEFNTVFVVGLENGLFPHERDGADAIDAEEERRLFYVALTRAKERAYMTYAASRQIFGSRNLTMPSEFITVLDPVYTELINSNDMYRGSHGRADEADDYITIV